MWPFESAEKRKIKKIIKEISEFTIKDLENKGLVSLYVTGSFLTKSRIISSNVGLIGIVGSQFRVDFEEARMNKILAEKKDTLCQGFNVLFPLGFHITGTPVLGISAAIEKGDKKKIELYKGYVKNYVKTEKEAVIKLNDGYLSTFTLQRLLNFKKSKDFNKDAYNLAKCFLEAGLNISKDLFIEYYQKI